ncbi:SRPBCC domain-containing protein [Leucobacter albus]|uniref:SRPBCC domain-containing protein n=1 Tax=Leucobacter albus TaxID=272210 RepID=A0ABW3TRC5_9MICO
MAAVGPVIARVRVSAARELAWSYIVDPELRASWWPDAELEAVFGGAISEQWVDGTGSEAAGRSAVGAIDVFIDGHALGFRWRDGADEHETAVLISLRSQAAETDIIVTETGFGLFPDAFERTADAQQSWIDLLSDLAEVLRRAAPAAAPQQVVPVENDSPAVPDAGAADAAEPVADEPGAAEPVADAADEPGADEPETAESGAAEFEAADAAEPGSTESDAEAVEPTDPELAAPEPVEADVAEPEAAEPESAPNPEPNPEPDFDSLIRGEQGGKP